MTIGVDANAEEVAGHCQSCEALQASLECVSRMRESIARRPANACLGKSENLKATYALPFVHDNCFRVHQMLRVTSCMQARVADQDWGAVDLVV